MLKRMPDMLAAVRKALDKKEWSHYRLVQSLKGKRPDGKDVPASVVYGFLRGETAINHIDLGLMLDVLDIELKLK